MPSSGTPVASNHAITSLRPIVDPTRRSGPAPSSARADTGRITRSTIRYHTALVEVPPSATTLKMYSAVDTCWLSASDPKITRPDAPDRCRQPHRFT